MQTFRGSLENSISFKRKRLSKFIQEHLYHASLNYIIFKFGPSVLNFYLQHLAYKGFRHTYVAYSLNINVAIANVFCISTKVHIYELQQQS